MLWLYTTILHGVLSLLLDLAHIHGQSLLNTHPSETDGSRKCCNGILGYAWHRPFFPCSEMRCCNSSETVALATVNHAVGFCFRCMPKELFAHPQKCYKVGQEVATTNTTTTQYEMRVCCDNAKFKVAVNTKDAAMVIRCVHR